MLNCPSNPNIWVLWTFVLEVLVPSVYILGKFGLPGSYKCPVAQYDQNVNSLTYSLVFFSRQHICCKLHTALHVGSMGHTPIPLLVEGYQTLHRRFVKAKGWHVPLTLSEIIDWMATDDSRSHLSITYLSDSLKR